MMENYEEQHKKKNDMGMRYENKIRIIINFLGSAGRNNGGILSIIGSSLLCTELSIYSKANSYYCIIKGYNYYF